MTHSRQTGPKRPRSHEIDSKARSLLPGLFPSSWVIREQSDDYGIDFEGEIFEEGASTGVLFKIQLKGTDGIGSRPKVRVKTDHLTYWKALPVPVLIILIDVNSGVAFAKWAHAVDELKRYEELPTTFDVRFTDANQITVDSSSRIRQDIHVVYGLRHKQVPWPIPVRIVADDSWSEKTVVSVRAHLARIVDDSGVVTTRVAIDGEPTIELLLDSMMIRAALPAHFASCSIDVAYYDRKTNLEAARIAADAVVLVAAALISADFGEQSMDLARRVLTTSNAVTFPEIADRLFAAALEDAPLATKVDFIEFYLDNDPSGDLIGTWILFAKTLDELERTPNEKSRRLVEALKRRSERERVDGSPYNAGICMNNAGAVHFHVYEHKLAFELFELAATLKTEYHEDPQFARYRASCLWHMERFDDAAEGYQRSIGLGAESAEITPLLADSLLHAGRYEDAFAALGDWDAGSGPHDSLGVIVAMIAQYLVNIGISKQTRSQIPQTDVDSFQATRQQDEHSRLVHLDALDPRVWTVTAEGHLEDQFIGLLICAHIARTAAGEWAAAAQWAFLAGAPIVAEILIDQGFNLCADDFLLAAEEPSFEGIEDSDFLDLVHSIAANRPRYDPNAWIEPFRDRLGDLLNEDAVE